MSANESIFHQKLRLRVCGLLVEDECILLAQIHSPVTESLIWTPPGGGLQFGERLCEGVKREFDQETHLQISVGNLLHLNELVSPPFHAVELYFEVQKEGGGLKLGSDPELNWDQQLIRDLQWIAIDELGEVNFAPQNLIPKLRDWEHRSDFQVFE